MNYFIAILMSATLIYGAFMMWCVIGWRKIKMFRPVPGNYKTLVSVIVPARNEEHAITDCLDAIIHQNYPVELVEIIVVDDHSTDSTVKVILAVMENNSDRRILVLSNDDGKDETGFKKTGHYKSNSKCKR